MDDRLIAHTFAVRAAALQALDTDRERLRGSRALIDRAWVLCERAEVELRLAPLVGGESTIAHFRDLVGSGAVCGAPDATWRTLDPDLVTCRKCIAYLPPFAAAIVTGDDAASGDDEPAARAVPRGMNTSSRDSTPPFGGHRQGGSARVRLDRRR